MTPWTSEVSIVGPNELTNLRNHSKQSLHTRVAHIALLAGWTRRLDGWNVWIDSWIVCLVLIHGWADQDHITLPPPEVQWNLSSIQDKTPTNLQQQPPMSKEKKTENPNHHWPARETPLQLDGISNNPNQRLTNASLHHFFFFYNEFPFCMKKKTLHESINAKVAQIYFLRLIFFFYSFHVY